MHTQQLKPTTAANRSNPYQRPQPDPSSPVHEPYLAMIQKAILLFNPEKGQYLFSPLVVSLSGGMSEPMYVDCRKQTCEELILALGYGFS